MFLVKQSTKLVQLACNNINYSQYRELRKISRILDKVPVQSLADPIETPQSELSTSESNQEKSLERRNEQSTSLGDVAPNPLHTYVPTFNLAAYVNKSESLQQLMKLGVNLSSIEKRKGLAEFVLKLDFETNVKPHLIFLNDLGIPADQFGEMITKNPLLFKEDLNDLETRINYLEAKQFQQVQIRRIVMKNLFWLMFSTKRIDQRLGYFQETYKLQGDDIRFLATKQPRLITYNMEHLRKSHFTIKEEMGFDTDEMQCLLLNKPRLWMMNSDELIERFGYAHRVMKLSHDMIMQFPEILTSREFRVKQRHEFLRMLGKAQYDPKKDLYVSPKTLVEGTDWDFVVNVAKSDMITYDTFLRTL